MSKEFVLKEKRKELREDMNYLFSKINWGASFLDAKAIKIMNEFWKDLTTSDEEFVRLLKEEINQHEDIWERGQRALKDICEIIDKLAGAELSGER